MKFAINEKSWNNFKFNLREKDEIVTDTKSLPEDIKIFCDICNVSIIDYRDLKNKKEHITGTFEIKGNEYNVFECNWDNFEEKKNIYIEAIPDNFISTLIYFPNWCRYLRNQKLQDVGYKFYILMFKDLIPQLTQQQVNLLNDNVEILCPEFKDEKLYKPRFSILPDTIDTFVENKYCHIISNGTKVYDFYRRYYLNTKLNEILGDKLVTNNFLGDFDTAIVSHPSSILPKCKTLIYDRSDNWSANYLKDEEQNVLSKADKIICSSKYLYNDTLEYLKKNRPNDNVEVRYIPNANVKFDYPKNVKKYGEKSAIYIGNMISKVDIELLYKICEANPHWLFYLYINERDIPLLEDIPINLFVRSQLSLEQLYPILCKCHAGLILFKKDEWTSGMLPNKLFNYINARIPTIYSGVEKINIEDYQDVCIEYDETKKLDELLKDIPQETYSKLERSWEDTVSEIIDFLKLEENEQLSNNKKTN